MPKVREAKKLLKIIPHTPFLLSLLERNSLTNLILGTGSFLFTFCFGKKTEQLMK